MAWDCEKRGCYNAKHRLDFGVFYECLPGRISLQDIDASTEVNGHFLYIEWKSGSPRPVSTGQRLYAERLTLLSPKITYVFVCGDAATMAVTHYCVMHHGQLSPWQPTSLAWLKQRIKRWSAKAQRARR